MKIAMVVPGGVDRSGMQRVIPALLALIERLARHHRVHVVALDQHPEFCCYQLLGATVTNLGRAPLQIPGANLAVRYRRLMKVIREDGPFDIVHGFWAAGCGTLAVMAGRKYSVPTIVSIGGGEFAALPQIGYGGQLRWRTRRQIDFAVHNASTVTAGSTFALHQCGRADARWVPLGVDPATFMPLAEGPPGPPWRLLQVANINQVKDQFTALRTLRVLLDRGLDLELEIVGEDTLSGALHKFARTLSLQARVRFSGFVAHTDLPARYAQAHLYLQSSLHESQGVSVLEAAVSGLPIVGTDVGLVAELAPVSAVSAPVADPLTLADAVQRVLENPALRSHLARNARRFASTYNADWTCSRFEQLYAESRGYVARATTDASGVDTGTILAARARS